MPNRLIGLSGYARAGKDTLGMVLNAAFGHQRAAFADTLRNVLYATNPDVQVFEPGLCGLVAGEHYPCQEVVDSAGWEWAKANTQVRGLLQRLGTEGGRQCISDTVWVDALVSKVRIGRWAITDCRFPNEARAVADAGGEMWRINRPGITPVTAHPSETALDDWPFDRVLDVPPDLTPAGAVKWYQTVLGRL